MIRTYHYLEAMPSKEANELLENNGYKVQITENLITCIESNNTRWVFLIGGILISLILILFASFYPLISSLVFLGMVALVASKFVFKKGFSLPANEPRIYFIKGNQVIRKEFLNNIVELKWTSTFVSEYASPFKSTSTEYEYCILIKLLSNESITLFRFTGDYSEPDAVFHEVYDWIKYVLKKEKETAQ